MKIKRILCIIFIMIMVSGVPVLAMSSITAKSGENSVTISIPSKFTVMTAEDIDQSSVFFQDMPLSKNEAVERIRGGVLIDGFSNDKQREIKVTVSTDSVSRKIVNFTPLPDNEKQTFTDTLKSGLQQKGHIFLSQPQIIEQSGYSFVKYFARIGGSDSGYSYMALMTIIGGKYYEATCYNSTIIPDQDMIDSNDEVIKSLKLDIKGDSGEIAANIFQTIVSYIITLVAVIVIIAILYSFAKQIVDKSHQDDQISSPKRK